MTETVPDQLQSQDEDKKTSRTVSESDIIARVEAAGNKITEDYGGEVYYGQMEGSKRHGYGTYTYASGGKYVGEWKNGKRHGQGTLTFADGTISHSGEWVNDQPKKEGETKNVS